MNSAGSEQTLVTGKAVVLTSFWSLQKQGVHYLILSTNTSPHLIALSLPSPCGNKHS
jgi:hypothetical protein